MAAGPGSVVRLWDVNKRRVLGTSPAVDGGVDAIACNAQKQWLAVASAWTTLGGEHRSHGSVTVWGLTGFELIATSDEFEGVPCGVGISRNGGTLGVIMQDDTFRLFSLPQLNERKVQTGKSTPEPFLTPFVWSVDQRERRQWLASGGEHYPAKAKTVAGFVTVNDVATAEQPLRAEGLPFRVFQVTFSPNGRSLAAIGGGEYRAFSLDGKGFVWIWDTAAWKVRTRFEAEAVLQCASFSPDGRLLVCGDSIGTVHVWDVTAEERVATLETSGGGVSSVAFRSDGKILVTGSQDNTIRLWSVSRIGE